MCLNKVYTIISLFLVDLSKLACILEQARLTKVDSAALQDFILKLHRLETVMRFD